MALRMVALNRASDGRWFARKGIPEDVRNEYALLYGVRREAHLRLPANTPRYEAKVRLGEWESEVETRIATLRALALSSLGRLNCLPKSTTAFMMHILPSCSNCRSTSATRTE